MKSKYGNLVVMLFLLGVLLLYVWAIDSVVIDRHQAATAQTITEGAE